MGSVAAVDYNLTSKSIAPSGPHDVVQSDLSTIFVNTNIALFWLKVGSAARSVAKTTIFGPVDFYGSTQSSVADIGFIQYTAGLAADSRNLQTGLGDNFWGDPVALVIPPTALRIGSGTIRVGSGKLRIGP
jgi:hypothetical protein